MRSGSATHGKRRGWRFWSFVVLNVAGLILVYPLLKVTLPLVNVWWYTRSQTGLKQHYQQTTRSGPAARAPEMNPDNPTPATGTADPDQTLQSLTNQLAAVQSVSDKDLRQIVAQHFGVSARPGLSSAQFDLSSAVFDSISRTSLVYQGKTYYGYRVNLVDQNGNHKTNIDCFAEPNLEYERSMATMQLINNSPQLKRIYQAMASSLADKSANPTNQADKAGDGPALRFDPGAAAK